MKYTLLSLLVLLNAIAAPAQKNVLYGDAGICMAYTNPGFSLTYNYNVLRKFGVGAGAQEYVFHAAIQHTHQVTPAVFGEVRFTNRPMKKIHFFSFFDLGVDLYAHNNYYSRDGNIIYTAPDNNGVYAGLGCGYLMSVTKRHSGPYASLKMISNWYKVNEYNSFTTTQRRSEWADATLVLSIGFKF